MKKAKKKPNIMDELNEMIERAKKEEAQNKKSQASFSTAIKNISNAGKVPGKK